MARKRSFLQHYITNFRKIVPIFAARFSGVFADLEAPGDESGKNYELAQDAVY